MTKNSSVSLIKIKNVIEKLEPNIHVIKLKRAIISQICYSFSTSQPNSTKSTLEWDIGIDQIRFITFSLKILNKKKEKRIYMHILALFL